MAVESSKETGEGQVEALIDDLIRDILSDSGASSESSMRGAATTAALFDTAFGSTRGDSRTSMLERLLIAEVFASELAEALAPALAEQLAPRLMKGFEHLTTEAAGQKPAAGSRSTSQRRKPERRLSKLGWFASASAEGMTAASRASLVPGERVDSYRPGDDQGGTDILCSTLPGKYAQNADNRASWPNGALDLIHARPDALPSFSRHCS